ncbi:aminoacyl-tRNA hydrolase [Treponema sp.]|uniref:aminoacyl-tRNA hydrolase n=1 Tax=Treponema sp. TaxID=166 RepID=UPI003EFCBD69
MIQLVAFLGNYGKEYSGTRHNAPWIFEEQLPFASKILWQKKHKSEFACMDFSTVKSWLAEAGFIKPEQNSPAGAPEKIFFMKPLTYMNLSGEAVGEAARFFKLKPENILIVHDEIELPLGTLSLKWSGGLGGHNGLRSIKENLGTTDFWRMRLGVGKPAHGNVADFVLGEFSADEKIILSQVFPQAEILFSKLLFSSQPEKLVNEWKKKKVIPETA